MTLASIPSLTSLDNGLQTVNLNKSFLPQVTFGHGVLVQP